MPAAHKSLPPSALRAGIVVCRGGLEPVVADELRELDIEVKAIRKRAIDIETDLAGIYRANMALRSALNVLLPIRSFNARNYDLLYYQSRKTNWHKFFPVEARLRIEGTAHLAEAVLLGGRDGVNEVVQVVLILGARRRRGRRRRRSP